MSASEYKLFERLVNAFESLAKDQKILIDEMERIADAVEVRLPPRHSVMIPPKNGKSRRRT